MGEPEIAKMAFDRENDHTRKKNKNEEMTMEYFNWELFLMNLFGRNSRRNPPSTFTMITAYNTHVTLTTPLLPLSGWIGEVRETITRSLNPRKQRALSIV